MSERRRIPPVTKMKTRPKRQGVRNLGPLQIKHNGLRDTSPKGTVIKSDGADDHAPSREEVDANWERIFGKGKYD